jgi:hypothetical protein
VAARFNPDVSGDVEFDISAGLYLHTTHLALDRCQISPIVSPSRPPSCGERSRGGSQPAPVVAAFSGRSPLHCLSVQPAGEKKSPLACGQPPHFGGLATGGLRQHTVTLRRNLRRAATSATGYAGLVERAARSSWRRSPPKSMVKRNRETAGPSICRLKTPLTIAVDPVAGTERKSPR